MPRLVEGNGDTSARHCGKSGCSADPYASHESHINSFEEQVSYLIPSEVRMFSGCHSLETSVDLHNLRDIFRDTSSRKGGLLPLSSGRSGGACTSALLSILYNRHRDHQHDQCLHNKNHQAAGEQTTPSPPPVTFQQLLLELRQKLVDAGLSQVPQLTSSRPLDVEETPFSLSPDRPFCRRRGTNRALLVGINYHGQNGELSGCINDVKNVKKYLVEFEGYEEQHILCLVDDGSTPHFPTRQNIIRALQQLVAQSVPGDAVYFHYSGHGGLLDKHFFSMPSSPSTSSSSTLAAVSKKDYEETLYPVDHSQAGQIRDFNLFHHFVQPMPAGVVVTCVMDCCHSGSVLELPYTYRPKSSGGTICSRQSMDQLSHLALLYILAGGMLPDGMLFEGLSGRIADAAGVASVDELQGISVEDLNYDTESPMDGGGFGFESREGNIDGLDNMDDAGSLIAYGQDNDLRGYDEGAVDSDDIAVMHFGGFEAADGEGDPGNVFVVGEDDNIDCGCVADVLGALLED